MRSGANVSKPCRAGRDWAGERPSVLVVGVGAGGWTGLTSAGRAAVDSAEVIVGSSRQLDLIDPRVQAERVRLPSPLAPGLPGLLERYRDRRLCVLASGDPMFYGIGSTLVRLLDPGMVEVVPNISSVNLACAELRWAVETVTVISAVGRPMAALQPVIQPGRRALVLTADGNGADDVAAILRGRGFGPSRITVLERLGAKTERMSCATAGEWSGARHDPLAIVAIECRPGPCADLLSTAPGLPDSAYDTDGQLTKREIRAMTLSALAPLPGQLLWDVGAGTGTVGIEWMRTHPDCRAVAIEPRPDRCDRIGANATALGVPGLRVISGRAPQALAGLPRPDAIFVGGAVSEAGVIDACMAALGRGGRLVANAVTLEAEHTLTGWCRRAGGELTRISLCRAGALGEFTGWRPAMPVTQWTYTEEKYQ
jgi:precorrin-6Y C5,15-methyltransferase (decarboxylating)